MVDLSSIITPPTHFNNLPSLLLTFPLLNHCLSPCQKKKGKRTHKTQRTLVRKLNSANFCKESTD